MSLLEVKSVTMTERGQIAIPRDIREINGFGEGSKVVILAFEDRLELRPLKQLNEKMFSALASEKVLAKDWNSEEDKAAWKNL